MVLTRSEMLNSPITYAFFDNIEIMYGVAGLISGIDLLVGGYTTLSSIPLSLGSGLTVDGVYGRFRHRGSYLMDYSLRLLEGIENSAKRFVSLIKKQT